MTFVYCTTNRTELDIAISQLEGQESPQNFSGTMKFSLLEACSATLIEDICNFMLPVIYKNAKYTWNSVFSRSLTLTVLFLLSWFLGPRRK
jgi:hypothetical protein